MSGIQGSSKTAPPIIEIAVPGDAVPAREIGIASGIDAWTVGQYLDEIQRDDAVVLIARVDSKIAGFAVGRVVPGSVEGVDGEIYNIAVTASSRRQRLGTALLEAAIEWFISKGCEILWLEVRSANISAIQFYEKNGFTKRGLRRNFYSAPVDDAVLMQRSLGRQTTPGDPAKACFSG